MSYALAEGLSALCSLSALKEIMGINYVSKRTWQTERGPSKRSAAENSHVLVTHPFSLMTEPLMQLGN